jgi:hypothetical protein
MTESMPSSSIWEAASGDHLVLAHDDLVGLGVDDRVDETRPMTWSRSGTSICSPL